MSKGPPFKVITWQEVESKLNDPSVQESLKDLLVKLPSVLGEKKMLADRVAALESENMLIQTKLEHLNLCHDMELQRKEKLVMQLQAHLDQLENKVTKAKLENDEIQETFRVEKDRLLQDAEILRESIRVHIETIERQQRQIENLLVARSVDPNMFTSATLVISDASSSSTQVTPHDTDTTAEGASLSSSGSSTSDMVSKAIIDGLLQSPAGGSAPSSLRRTASSSNVGRRMTLSESRINWAAGNIPSPPNNSSLANTATPATAPSEARNSGDFKGVPTRGDSGLMFHEDEEAQALQELDKPSRTAWSKPQSRTYADVTPVYKIRSQSSEVLYTESGDLRAAPLHVLLNFLMQDIPYPEYVEDFLLTYRAFITPNELLEKLIEKFTEMSVASEDPKVKVLQIRFVNTLKCWVVDHFHDFQGNGALTERLSWFLETILQPVLPNPTQILRAKLQKQIEQCQVTLVFNGQTPPPLVPKELITGQFDVTDIDPLEFARQLTLIEYEMFKAIDPRECLNQAWNKKDIQDTHAPNIMIMIRHFNKVSGWVSSEILRHGHAKPSVRKHLISRFLKIANSMQKIRNYNGLVEIVAGLQMQPVWRLKKTWEALPDNSLNTWEKLKTLISNNSNYKNLRDAHRNGVAPVLPHLAVLLSDLTFVDEGNPNKLENDLINFKKHRMTAQVIKEITQYQQAPFCFETIAVLKDYLCNMQVMEDQELMKLSLLAEPRHHQHGSATNL